MQSCQRSQLNIAGCSSPLQLHNCAAEDLPLHALNKLPYGKLAGARIGVKEGVIFLTYSSLISSSGGVGDCLNGWWHPINGPLCPLCCNLLRRMLRMMHLCCAVRCPGACRQGEQPVQAAGGVVRQGL